VDWNSVPSSGRRVSCLTPLRCTEDKGARRRRAGFTLVEVIVVLVILAILAAIAIPALTGYIDKANTSQIKAKARSAAVAMQTILSEAYADPQTKLPVDNENYGELYVGGKMIVELKFNYDDVEAAPEDMYTFNGTNSKNFVDLFRKLDSSAIVLTEGEEPGVELEAVSMLNTLFDKHFRLIAYAYIDPETYSTDGYRICTYNMNISENVKFSYDLSAGFKVWSVDYSARKVTLVG
jgi:prepilin-type N-terminal cleavage/methylation domain-containing protein